MKNPSVDFGLGLRARHPSLLQEISRDAEAAGFNHIWVYDSPRFAEAFVAMSFCAMATSRAVIGTAVTNPETREPAVLANGFATLSTLTGGRVALGIGLGDSAVKFIGRKPATFEQFREKIGVLRSLLSGETIEYNGKSLKLPVPPQKRPPILIAAEGPKTFEYAGAACDGAIISPGGSPHFLRYAIAKIREAAGRAGRDPARLYICAWTHCVAADTRRAAIDELKPEVSRTLFKGAIRVPHEVLGLDRPLLSENLRRRALENVARQDKEYELADELLATMGDDLMRELTLVGTPEDIVDKASQLSSIDGVSQLIVNIHAKDRRLSMQVFRDRIIPSYGRR